jgi:hypothetical protein
VIGTSQVKTYHGRLGVCDRAAGDEPLGLILAAL